MKDQFQRVREELMGRYFSTKTELRHIAEGAGFNFVPVEFLSTTEKEALVSLRPKGLGEIQVRATRPAGWQPFFIVAVEPV